MKNTNTFVEFIDLTNDTVLALDRWYDVVISRAELVGKTLHLLVEVHDKDKKTLICERFAVQSKLFQDFVAAIYAMGSGYIVQVTTSDIEGTFGCAKLKLHKNRFAVDWSTFVPEQSPFNSLFFA